MVVQLRNCCGAAKRAGKTLGPLAAHALTFNGKKEEVRRISISLSLHSFIFQVKPRFMAMLLKLIFQLADNEEAKVRDTVIYLSIIN